MQSDDADDYPVEMHHARLLLAENGSVDENNMPIDAEEEKAQLRQIASLNDSKALSIVGKKQDDIE